MNITARRTLAISEVTTNICAYLDARSLAYMARTSKILYEPAKRTLWADLPDFVPLVRTFPVDAWKIRGSQLVLIRVLSPPDWSVFITFGRFVKTLGVVPVRTRCSRRDLKLSPSALLELCAMRPALALLPCLRSFNWRAMRLADKLLPLFLSLVGENLRSAFIDFDKGNDRHKASSGAFQTLSQRSPALRRLEIGTVDNLSLSVALRGFWKLTIFKCVTIALDEAGARTLASLPALIECAIRLPEPEERFFPNESELLDFPFLERLAVTGSVEAYGPFSRAVVCPTVTRFEWDVEAIPRPRDICQLFRAIRRQVRPESLEHLRVFTSTTKPAPNAHTTIIERAVILRPAHFASVFTFSRLRSFELSPFWGFQMNDGLFMCMAMAWPELEALSLGAAPGCIHIPRGAGTTLKALPPFAVQCPNLKTIALHLDASSGMTADEQVPEDLYGELWANGHRIRSTSKVTGLHLHASPIALPRPVAKFLSMIFPELDQVKSSSAHYAETPGRRIEQQSRQRRWAEVRRYIGMMRAARLDER